MRVNASHPLNAAVLAYLRRPERGLANREPLFRSAAESPVDPYGGTHPDATQFLWSLGVGTPGWVVGAPALVHQLSGVVLGVGQGTRYAIRVVDQDEVEGWSRVDGFGADWVYGRFQREAEAALLTRFVSHHGG